MEKKAKSTYEEFIEDDEQKALLDKEYKELLLSELLMAAMEHDHISVRKLASAAGVSPTIIQGLKSGSKTNSRGRACNPAILIIPFLRKYSSYSL